MDYQDWERFSTRPNVSDTHGGRNVQNYANTTAKNYGKYEDVGELQAGSVLAKDSFVVRAGKVSAGPLFLMEKMASGCNAASGNWRYTLVMPDGKGTKKVECCYGCHATAEETDSLFFLPEEYRVASIIQRWIKIIRSIFYERGIERDHGLAGVPWRGCMVGGAALPTFPRRSW